MFIFIAANSYDPFTAYYMHYGYENLCFTKQYKLLNKRNATAQAQCF